jgi:hypothetical protein
MLPPIPLMGMRPVKVSSARDARRLASRLIKGFQSRTIDSKEAKDLMYLLIGYVQAFKTADLEERIKALERRKS